ncbi:MAG: hypothetical protein HQK60_12305 [Deltaproteobacteria bacterium]|nr:hypothetical protein [Deltaproteobacteria bacterium]
MEIQTTVRDFPKRVESLHIPPDASIRVIVDAIQVEPEQKAEEQTGSTEKKGRWAKVVEKIRQEAPLAGRSEDLNRIIREFKDDFYF